MDAETARAHLLDVIDGYDARLAQMQRARTLTYNRDEFGNPKQEVRDTTNPSSRRYAASEARTALKALADRAMDLHIATPSDCDDFVHKLRISNRAG